MKLMDTKLFKKFDALDKTTQFFIWTALVAATIVFVICLGSLFPKVLMFIMVAILLLAVSAFIATFLIDLLF